MFHKKGKTADSASAENAAADNSSEVQTDGTRHVLKSKKGRIRIAAAAALIIVLAAAGMVIFASVSGNQGIRRAQKLSKKIGEPAEKAAAYASVELVKSSDFGFINELHTFTSLAEADSSTRVYDVGMPKWVIYCSENSFGKLESVTYCNFSVLSSNINGTKKNARIDTSSVSVGNTVSEVDKVLRMKPYQIVYSENSSSRKYKYYYKDKQTGDIKAYYITVIFGDDNKVNSPVLVEENNFIYDILKSENQ